MSDQKRQCLTCQYFQKAQLSGNGWCTHPKRQLASDVRILVREKELACRNSWGDDLWEDSLSNATTPDVVPTPRRGLFFASQRVDDEVTSVVDATSRKSQSQPDFSDRAGHRADDVVTHTSMREDDAAANAVRRSTPRNDLNAPANDDQAERVRIMARGPHDAVLEARARHADRRKPAQPPTGTEPNPDPAGASSDQVLGAQDREQYRQGLERNQARAESQPRDAYEATPPVPRSEVEANGNALSPASGLDVRFDSVPHVKSTVDLTDLREFLNPGSTPSAEHRTESATAHANRLSSYDHVHQRAQEIRAANEATRQQRHVSSRARLYEPVVETISEPGPEIRIPETQAIVDADDVVWDAEGDRLVMAFERARAAIDLPPVEVTNTVDLPEPAHQVADVDIDTLAFEPAMDEAFDEALDYEHAEFDDSAIPQFHKPQDSPRWSWWRSLNFGLKRNREVQAEPYPVEAEYDERFDDYETSGYQSESYAPGGYDSEEDGFFAESDELPDFVAETSGIPVFVTSEESWREDVRDFPEPQPAEWHETRAQLFASQVHFEDEYPPYVELPSMPHFDDHGYLPIESSIPEPRTPSHFAIDEPTGMDAFRTALFGNAASDVDDFESLAPTGHPPLTRSAQLESIADTSDLVDTGYRRSLVPPSQPSRLRRQRPATSPASGFGQYQSGFDGGFDIREAISDDDDEFDRQFAVASSVPKSCSTCRSFRPTETGERGWCANDWAFTHRQMVNAEDLPCRSSIGDWWLAADTSWIPPLDVIQPATPRTDRLVANSDLQNEPEVIYGRRVRTRRVV